MKLKAIASNLSEIRFVAGVDLPMKSTDISVAFSYETPVAGWDDQGAFKTDTKFSRTTSKHIRKYLGAAFDNARVVEQSKIEALTKGFLQ